MFVDICNNFIVKLQQCLLVKFKHVNIFGGAGGGTLVTDLFFVILYF